MSRRPGAPVQSPGASAPAITPGLFAFFRELSRHNDRGWFEANRDRYVRDVRDPLLGLIAAFGPRLAAISRHMVADPRPVGGSLFRIHRDTRFARDKTPYKTHAGIAFRHADGREVHGPVFYLHLAPGMVFAAAGMWRPAPEPVKRVRDAIAGRPRQWQRVVRACPLGEDEDGLTRAPRGYAPDHPCVEDLKRRTFITSTQFTEREACAPGFPGRLEQACRDATPLMKFLTGAVGLPW
jgi:uncharacterized protein (TIGR02453 family)